MFNNKKEIGYPEEEEEEEKKKKKTYDTHKGGWIGNDGWLC